jgi:transcriptional regulator with XRE-family HTH domain
MWYPYVMADTKHVVWKERYLMEGSLAKRLRVLRAQRGMTLREAANLVHVRPATLSDIEHGRSRPHDLTLAKIAEGYGVQVEELIEEPARATSGKAEAPDPGPSLLDKALGAARRDAQLDAQAIARLLASEGKPQSVASYEEDKFRAELRTLGFPDEHFEDFVWPLVELAVKTKQLEEQLAACEAERRLLENRV